MQKIFRLDPHVADLIAAGEVVERPASVVKELAENAVDAGASAVTVEIRGGGLASIRVTDNGCGMSAEDAQTAFLRHATSKLRDARGLEAIGTLGFRGEALAAIASVARVELLTRERGADAGTRLELEGGALLRREAAGCPDGTTVLVRDLFYNTPARLKFMKNDRTEGSAVTSAVLRCALSRPELSLRYLRDGEEEFHTPGDGRADSCIYSLLGRDFAAGLLEAGTENDGVRVSGYVSSPASVRGNRNHQFFFVNGRCIRSRTLQAALEQAYRNRLPVARYPACVLYIEMSRAGVDVNVHPAKTEVRFLKERQVFDAVYYAALGALDAETGSAEIRLSPSTEKILRAAPAEPERRAAAPAAGAPAHREAKPAAGFYRRMDTAEYGSYLSGAPRPGAASVTLRNTSREVYQTRIPMAEPARTSPPPEASAAPAPELRAEDAGETEPFRLIGEALSTYILAEQGDRLILIDKHAAHERILFDRLKSRSGAVMSQLLLTPAVCKVGEAAAALAAENAPVLAAYGIEAEDFGSGSVIVRQVPEGVDAADVPALMEEVCAALAASGGTPEERTDRILHSVACKAAIKAGRRSDPRELQAIAEIVLAGGVRYCPHGRPVSVELTRETLDKNFRRT